MTKPAPTGARSRRPRAERRRAASALARRALDRRWTQWAIALDARHRAFAVGGLLCVALLIVYRPALDGALLWDDDAHITAPALRSLGGLWRIWGEPGATQQYYPVTHSAFWLLGLLWGSDPTGYHVVNVLLHWLNALLVWRILASLAVPGALIAAMIFAFHPVHVESVAWITELKNTLSGLFYLAALAVYLRFDPLQAEPMSPGQKAGAVSDRDRRLYGLSLGLFLFALLTKTVTASLPAVILLIAWWKTGRIGLSRHLLPLLPFFVLGGGLGLATAWVERRFLGAEGPDFAFTGADRVLIAGRAVWFYAAKLLWPVGLVFSYPRWTIDRTAWWQYLYPLAALAVVGALWAWRQRLGRGPLVAVLFFGGTLVPALGFFNVYPFVYTFVADHFQYLASLGIITLAAAAAVSAVKRLGDRRRLGAAAAGLVILALAALSWRQAHLYMDLETLYRHVISNNPTGIMAYLNLGNIYSQQGRYGDAIDLYRRVIELRPDYAATHVNIGNVHASQGRYPEAIAAYEAALALKPNLATARYHLGLAYLALGRHVDAAAQLKAAVAIRPDMAEALRRLATAYRQLGQHAELIATLKALAAIKPVRAETYHSLGMAHAALGQATEAIGAFRAAIAINPRYPEAYNDLGIVHRKQGQLDEAIGAYRAAVAIKPDFAHAHNNLGAAYASGGRYDEAIAAWQQAVRLDPYGEAGKAATANIEMARARQPR